MNTGSERRGFMCAEDAKGNRVWIELPMSVHKLSATIRSLNLAGYHHVIDPAHTPPENPERNP